MKLEEILKKVQGDCVLEGYGLTETTSFSCINCYPKTKRVIGSIGKELSVNDMLYLIQIILLKMKTVWKGKFVLGDIMLQNTIII